MNKFATLFGGGFNDTTTQEYKDTVEIGKMLAKKGYTVKNGGYTGLMEAVSKGATENGGQAIGYTCETFRSVKGNDYLTVTSPSKDIYDRLRNLIEGTDIYIFQKGGIGTLSEFFTVWDELRKRKDTPKMILVGEHWYLILESLCDLITLKELDKLKVVKRIEDLGKEL
jgi:uncharacterized protein (TIGR00725 family)